MNLEQIKHDKVKEAEELFTKLGIDYNQEQEHGDILTSF